MQSRRHHANHCMWCYPLWWSLACCVSSFSGTVVLWKGDCGRAGENRIVVRYQPLGTSLLSWLSKQRQKKEENAAQYTLKRKIEEYFQADSAVRSASLRASSSFATVRGVLKIHALLRASLRSLQMESLLDSGLPFCAS